MYRPTLLLASAVLFMGCGKAAPPKLPVLTVATSEAATLARTWPDGCFTIERADGTIVETDHARCAMARRPYSTFKLANALIAVDAGVLAGPEAAMTWDKVAVPDDPGWPAVWRQPHTLRSGIAVSAVPYFRTLALTLGADRMKAGLAKLGYGNQDIAPALDTFWLTGGLRISAAQQLRFVEALGHGTLVVSAHAQDVVRDVSVLARAGGAVLHGKTGTGDLEDGRPGWLAWQVGYVEKDGAILGYAGWMEITEATDFVAARDQREARVRSTLDALGWFPR